MKLLESPATLATYTPRQEKNGNDQTEPAASLTMKATLMAEHIAQFFATADAAREFVAAVWDDDGNVRHGIAGPISLDRELIGGKVTLSLPQSKKTMDFDPADIKALSITPIEGHVAEVKYRLNCHPTEEQAGKLYKLQGREFGVTAIRAVAEAEKAGQQSMALSPAPAAAPNMSLN